MMWILADIRRPKWFLDNWQLVGRGNGMIPVHIQAGLASDWISSLHNDLIQGNVHGHWSGWIKLYSLPCGNRTWLENLPFLRIFPAICKPPTCSSYS